MSWKLSRTVLRGAVGGNAVRLLDQKIGTKTKQAFAIAMADDSPYAFAGHWESWKEKDGTRLETFTIITTDSNEVLEPLHDRMPVIIEPKDYDRWLEPADDNALPLDLLRPFPAERMKAWKANARVGEDAPTLWG